jgi:hypothetical protein
MKNFCSYMMVHITSICIGIYLENCKIQVYKIGNNITTSSNKFNAYQYYTFCKIQNKLQNILFILIIIYEEFLFIYDGPYY